MILHQNPPATARRLAGRTLVALLVCGGAYSSLAARADSAPATGANTYDIAMQVRIGQTNSTPRVHVKAGESFKIVVDDQDIKLAASFVASAVGPGFVKLAGTVECGNSAASHPVLITRLGETAKVKLQDGVAAPCEVDIVVSELASAVKG